MPLSFPSVDTIAALVFYLIKRLYSNHSPIDPNTAFILFYHGELSINLYFFSILRNLGPKSRAPISPALEVISELGVLAIAVVRLPVTNHQARI